MKSANRLQKNIMKWIVLIYLRYTSMLTSHKLLYCDSQVQTSQEVSCFLRCSSKMNDLLKVFKKKNTVQVLPQCLVGFKNIYAK